MIKWNTRKTTVTAGEYAESATVVTEHYSTDGRFTITPKGSMKYRRANGARGSLSYRFVWTGYRLADASPALPAYIPKSLSGQTVAAMKRAADRRAADYPVVAEMESK